MWRGIVAAQSRKASATQRSKNAEEESERASLTSDAETRKKKKGGWLRSINRKKEFLVQKRRVSRWRRVEITEAERPNADRQSATINAARKWITRGTFRSRTASSFGRISNGNKKRGSAVMLLVEKRRVSRSRLQAGDKKVKGRRKK